MADLRLQKAVLYDCPHCRTALAWDVGPWRGWALCPSCGKPGKPPAPRIVLSADQPLKLEVEATLADSNTKTRASAEPALDDDRPRWTRELDEIRRKVVEDERTSTVRTVVGVALASALFVMLVGYLDQNSTVISTAATAALVLFIVRMRLSRR